LKDWVRSGLSGAVGLWVSACALAGGEVIDLYDLSAARLEDTLRGGTSTQILIPEPTTVQAFNGNQIAVRTADQSIGYLADGRWTDGLPKLIQARLVESFEKSERVAAVGTPGEGLHINYSIRVSVRFFGLDVNGARRASLDFGAKILNESNGRVLASQSFAASVPAGPGTVGAVQALDAAFAAATRDLAQWVFSRI
jgi:cholesterol transport system auxiliary component